MKPAPQDVEAVARVLKKKGKVTAYQAAMDLQWFTPVVTSARAPDTHRVTRALIALLRQRRVVEDGLDAIWGVTVWRWVG